MVFSLSRKGGKAGGPFKYFLQITFYCLPDIQMWTAESHDEEAMPYCYGTYHVTSVLSEHGGPRVLTSIVEIHKIHCLNEFKLI